MVGGGDPFYLQFWAKLTPLKQKRRFSVDICWCVSAVASSKKVLLTLKIVQRFNAVLLHDSLPVSDFTD